VRELTKDHNERSVSLKYQITWSNIYTIAFKTRLHAILAISEFQFIITIEYSFIMYRFMYLFLLSSPYLKCQVISPSLRLQAVTTELNEVYREWLSHTFYILYSLWQVFVNALFFTILVLLSTQIYGTSRLCIGLKIIFRDIIYSNCFF